MTTKERLVKYREGYYYSESRCEYLLISKMNTCHIDSALVNMVMECGIEIRKHATYRALQKERFERMGY